MQRKRLNNYRYLIDDNEILRSITASFRAQGFQLWLVGGYVRDHLIGIDGTDVDMATDASPDEIWDILNGYRIDGYVCSPFDIGKRWGTCGLTVYPKIKGKFTIEEMRRSAQTIEITTFRTEIY